MPCGDIIIQLKSKRTSGDVIVRNLTIENKKVALREQLLCILNGCGTSLVSWFGEVSLKSIKTIEIYLKTWFDNLHNILF